MTPLRRRAGRGALFVLALTLASSGALRLGSGVGEALAQAGAEGNGATHPLVCPEPPAALAEALSAREARVSALEAAIEEQQAALVLTDTAIRDRLAELAKAEEDLAATLALADGAAEADLARLTEVYQTMKPKDAAALFETMSPDFSAGFLGRMRPDAAASILAGMTPESAYAVSVLLAGRNANAPTE